MKKVKISEAQVSNAVKHALILAENMGTIVWFRNNVGKIATRDNRYFQTGKKGFGDFVIGYHDKRDDCLKYAECETKSSTGVQSQEQNEHELRVTSLGGVYWLVNDENLQEFENWLLNL